MRWFFVPTSLALALTFSSAAGAKTVFECGVYRVSGKVYPSGALNDSDVARVRSEDAASKGVAGKKGRLRAPTLVLWAGTLSQTTVPLVVSDEQRRQLVATGAEPLLGEFDVEFFGRGSSPDAGTLVAFRPEPASEVNGGSHEARLLKASACKKAASMKKGGGK
ncbi:MAG TPA: hypothetical protein VL588_00365 [Bdellovibrionota bacterium]|jgi:hypothetical protein|nr:hypothetical protein [Bdellovibrionota bacterium]